MNKIDLKKLSKSKLIKMVSRLNKMDNPNKLFGNIDLYFNMKEALSYIISMGDSQLKKLSEIKKTSIYKNY